MKLIINLNDEQILNKLSSNEFGLFVSKEWKKQIDPFTPKETGTLEGNIELLPFGIHYKQNYAHYMYEGIVYVDPVTGASGFLTDEGWKSRYGVTKVKSNRKLKYGKVNPYSTDHWDIKAARAGRLRKLYKTLNLALQRGIY